MERDELIEISEEQLEHVSGAGGVFIDPFGRPDYAESDRGGAIDPNG